MMRPSAEVRSVTPDEMPRAIAAIVAAFLTDYMPLRRTTKDENGGGAT